MFFYAVAPFLQVFFWSNARAFERWTVTVGKKKKNLSRVPHLWQQVCQDKLKIDFEIIPVALTRAQIDEHNPPPNPAKRTDSRFVKFNALHGDTSWEVDALRPEVLNEILTKAIEERIDREKYEEILDEESSGKTKLFGLRKYLNNDGEDEDE